MYLKDPKYMKKYILLLLLLPCLNFLKPTKAFSGSLPEQRFFFEMTHSNYAWVKRLHGAYIDRQGNVYTYDHSHAVWEPADPSSYTEEELLQKFESKKEQIGTVDAATLQHMAALIDDAAKGRLSESVNACNDAGITVYLAYQFDRDTGKYLPVLLYQAGDWAQKNQSQEAEILYEWLFTFEGWKPGACFP
jgi:hypothetical protein